MTKYVRLPDGSLFPVKEGETEAQAFGAAYDKYPDAWGEAKGASPKSGFMPALKAGIENIKGDVAAVAGRSGIMDLTAAEKYRAEKQKRAAELFKPTEDNWIESPLTKIGELAGGSLPYMAAPIAAGVGAAALGAPAMVGAGAAGLASAAQFTGSNLSRQVETGKKLGETDLGAAALAALPQAALDMVGFKMLPGIRNIIFKGTGKKLSEEAAKNIAQQSLKQVAADYAKTTGKTMTAEGLTEAGQQVFERLQAGLNIGDPEARQEYFDNFVGGAVLGGVMAPAGRAAERGQIKSAQAKTAADAEQQRIAAAQTAADEAQAAKVAHPDYIPGLMQQSQQYAQQVQALTEAAKGVDAADPVAVAAAKQAKAELQALKGSDAYRAHLDELQAVAPQIQTMRAQQAKDAATATATAQADREARLVDPTIQRAVRDEYNSIEKQNVDLDARMQAAISAGNHDEYQALAEKALALQKRREELQSQLGAVPTVAAVPDMATMQAQLARLEGGVNAKGKPTLGQIIKLKQSGDIAGSLALSKEAADLRTAIADRTKSAAEMEQRTQLAEQQRPSADPVNPMANFVQDMESMDEGRSENAAINETRQMEAARMPTQFTEQRTLPLSANPIQYPSAATVQRREQTLEGLKNEFGALVRSARLQRVQGKVPPVLQEQITAKADEIRDFGSALARQNVSRGQATADVAPALAGTQLPGTLPRGQSVESVERTYTPEKATEDAVRAQLGGLPTKLAPQDEALVQQVTAALPALKNAGEAAETVAVPPIEGVPYDKVTAEMAPTRALDDVSEYLHRLRTGTDATREAAQVQAHLDRLEQGKRSETQTPARETAWGTATKPTETAVQEDMFADTELQGAIFDSYADFENYLAGDAVKTTRAAVGRTLATAARLHRDMAPLEAKVAQLRTALAGLQEVQAFTISAGDASVARAQAKHQAATEAMQAAIADIEVKLAPQEKALQQAQLDLYAAVSAQLAVSDAIAKNTAKFNRDPGLQAAAAKVAAAQEVHAARIKRASVTGKASFNLTTQAYNAVVEALNEQRTMLEGYAKDSRKLQERSILAFLNRDMELMLRLRDAEQTSEKARAAVDTARAVLDDAHETLQNAHDTQQALREAAQKMSAAQGVLTKSRNRAMTARTREAGAVAETSDALQALEKEIAEATKPVRTARDARIAPPLAERQTQREDADAAKRKEAQERADRLAAIPGAKVSHENVRTIMADVERMPERIRAMDAAAKDETSSQAVRNKAKYEAADLRARAKIMYGLISNDPKFAEEAVVELDKRIAGVEEKVGGKQAAVIEPGKSASTIRSRRKELAELKTDLRQLKRLRRLADNRAAFAPVGTAKQTSTALADRAEQLENLIRTEESAPRLAAYKAELKTVNRELDKRDEAESRLTAQRIVGIADEGTTGRLPARVRGPVVKSAVQAGNVRTGDTSTIGERTVSVRNKITQSGTKRGMTSAQAVKQSAIDTAHEQALLKLSDLETLQERNSAALAKAQAAKDTEKIAKYTGFAERLAKGIVAAEKKVSKTAETSSDAFYDADEAASQFRSDRQTTEVDDDVVMAVQDGRVLDAAKLLATRGSTPEVRARAAKLVPRLIRTKLKVDSEVTVNGKSVAGKFDPSTNTITMHPGGINEEDLLHEMTHAATDRTLLAPDSTLTEDQRAAKRELEALRVLIVASPKFDNEDIGNVREFAAEVYSNPELKAKMDSLGKPLTLWQRFKNLVSRLLGWGGPEAPLSKKAQDLVERIMQPSRNIDTSALGNSVKATMYHGSPNAGLEKLQGVSFFSPNRQVAEEYAKGTVAFTGKTVESGGKVYQAKVNTVNTLDMRKPEHRAEYAKARAAWNAEHTDPDEKLPPLTSEGFLMSNTSLPGYGNVRAILQALPTFDSMYVDEGSQGISLAVRDGAALDLGVAASAWRAGTAYDTTSALGKMSNMITAKPTSPLQRLGHNVGLSIEMWGVDMRAPLMKALSVAGEKALTQATYYVRKADALMNHVYASLSEGPLQLVKTAKGNFEIKAGKGPSMKVLLEAVKDIKGVSPEDKMGKLQAYMAAQRAERVGWDKLNFENAADMHKQATAMAAELAVDPAQKAALEKARKVYNDINKGTVDFLAESGYISKAKAAELLQHGDYVPFYRVRPNGMAELVMGESAVIHVGDLRNNKFLAPLVGDDQKLLPLNESIVRNTMLLTDMALKNLATKDVAYAMQKIGAGSGNNGRSLMPIHRGESPRGEHDIIRFRQEPDPSDADDTGERWLRVRTQGTAVEHIPSEMLVQSLEGSFSTLPAGLKAAAWFGDILRSGVTRNPMYIARQLIRDPLSATFTGGLDSGITKSVFRSLSNYVEQSAGRSKEGAELLRKGMIHSGIFTGDVDDINKMMLQLTKGDEGAFKKTLAWWDKAAMNADAATRIQMYKDARAKGMDEMESELAAMEMMNFNKRGLSPTVQYAARMIPFLNAQIQGLNVLYKAMTGGMPQNEKLAIKEKFYRRALTMTMFTVGYALAMEDDDTYKNARARDRYNNWLLPNPLGGEHIKIPIPFEVGVLFKALPEALVDVMRSDFNDEEFKAIRQAFTAQIPGSGSYGLPQAIKPAIEVVTNHNFFTDREIETQSDRGKASTERFGAGTSEIAKEASNVLNAMGVGLSPKQVDHLVSGYLGSLPVMVARLTNNIFAATEGATRPTERVSDSPVYGALFQREMGGGPVDAAYAHEEALAQAKRTYDSMVNSGRKADALVYKEDVLNALGSPELARAFKSKIDLLQKADKAARVQIKDPDALRARLDVLERQKHEAAKLYLNAVNQIAH